MEKKSLAKNAVYSLIKNLVSLLFPLITLPYVNRVLGLTNVGKYNFAYSIIHYFLLIAALGISGYTIREGARIRDKKQKVTQFLSEMYSMSIIATLVAYVGLIILLFVWRGTDNYRELIIIFGFIILFSPFAVTWLFTIYEDFEYITKRTILFQIISIVMMFLLVRKSDDVNMYAVVTVVSNVGANIFNFIYSKKYCHLKFTFKINWKRHIKPIMIIFITSLAISVFVNSDMTILGIICTDDNVGLYSVSVKIYNLINNALLSVLTVMQARLAFFIGSGQKENFDKLSNSIINFLIIFILPIMSGVMVLSKEIIFLLSGKEFLGATSSLCILIVATIFTIFGSFFNTCILMPHRREGAIFWLSVGTAVVNIVLNIVLIPLFAENAAAFTTVLAQFMIFLIEFFLIKPYMNYDKKIFNNLIVSLLGCGLIFVISMLVHMFTDNVVFCMVLIIILSVIVYALFQYIMKNSFFMDTIKMLKGKLHRKKNK